MSSASSTGGDRDIGNVRTNLLREGAAAYGEAQLSQSLISFCVGRDIFFCRHPMLGPGQDVGVQAADHHRALDEVFVQCGAGVGRIRRRSLPLPDNFLFILAEQTMLTDKYLQIKATK